jgi:signal transduction histidine kinase
MLLLSLVMTYSLCGPDAAANWNDLPITTTPAHALLLMTTTAAMVLAVISRQLQLALTQAKEASAVKSRFIGLMSHELRTPLNAILGFSELMKMKSLRELDEEVGALDNIHASGQRLLAMIDALLSHAGKGETIFELDKEPLHLRSAVEGALTEFDETIDRCGGSVEVHIPPDLFLNADARALRQILHVLLAHSLRACGKQSAISIAARHGGTDTLLEIEAAGLKKSAADELDEVESQLVNALVLAHGGRVQAWQTSPSERHMRLRFFATRAA